MNLIGNLKHKSIFHGTLHPCRTSNNILNDKLEIVAACQDEETQHLIVSCVNKLKGSNLLDVAIVDAEALEEVREALTSIAEHGEKAYADKACKALIKLDANTSNPSVRLNKEGQA